MGNKIFKRSSNVDLDDPVNLTHFNLYRSIGRGAFAKVCIAEKKDTKQLYALKYMNKEHMIRTDKVFYVLREQDILIKLDHSNIIKLWFTFQDEEDVFMVTDLFLGGDLSYHVERYGRMSFDQVKLYVAEVGMGLDYLKSKSIIHRDIKPANLLLNEKGHVLISDFNTACDVRPGVPVLSIAGTRPYMAPEVFVPPPEGYKYEVDWWSLGVTAYQLLRAQYPFKACFASASCQQMADYISSRAHLQMSTTWSSRICDFLYKLIQPNSSRRIKSVEDLKTCKAYEGVDWDAIKSQTYTPPFVPPKGKLFCNPAYEFDELFMESHPLREKRQRLKRRRSRSTNEPADPTSDIGHLFMPYNRTKSLDVTGKPLSLEKEVLEGMAAGKQKTSVASEGNRSNSECISTQSFSKGQNFKERSSSDSAPPFKERAEDDGREDKPLVTGMTTVILEN